MLPPGTELHSIGKIASSTQTPVRDLLSICKTLGIAPSLTLNGVPNFATADMQRIVDAARIKSGTTLAGPLNHRSNIH